VTPPRPTLRSRILAPALGLGLALLAVASFGGCFVSFDGYELSDAGGASDGASGNAGSTSSGRGGSESVAGSGGELSGGGTSPIAGSSSGGATGASGGGASGGRAGAGGMSGGANTSGAPNAGAGGAAACGASAGSGGSGGSAGGPVNCAVGKPGAILVEITRAGGTFCIDRTEVTNADYAQFLASNPTPALESAACKANTDFTPASDPTNCTQYDPINKRTDPVACVNWCDAQAFCAWAGKRLCGKIGGGTNAVGDFADATKSEWYDACSHAGQYKFPYGAQGDTYSPDACIGSDSGFSRPAAVPTPSCQGGYEGVFDMSGNVSEWEDSCAANTGLTDQCLYRGGSYLDLDTGTTPTLLCNSGTSATPKAASKPRSTRDKEIGFRCCDDL
jgi:sulfatase modifying factor 1